MGHSYTMAVLHSSKERSPRAVAAQYSASIAGRYLNVIEVFTILAYRITQDLKTNYIYM